ncbi:adenine phosphoribosyltransferase [Cronobacter sakazakii]|nr:adenine phosphoribosyltransferase [Cronobacter sakazakii]EGT4260438.1 adenine phosphoribosyltransferase [Cronobacter sakazakii]EGT4270390.1 adenine phosphoribosyltransferase [Cronobacter sakazakii]EGT4301379.1 adenine phosphoribosyltransferase [Cronobacter sakazakii]EGT4318088.1 adenine phosphoribosyltransferase [Cronobacter sakazakii]
MKNNKTGKAFPQWLHLPRAASKFERFRVQGPLIKG